MITMSDVAERAGVSRQTVSHTLNDRTEGIFISEGTRRRVREVAETMGYRRNGSAVAMKSGRFGCAALLTSNRPHCSYTPQTLLDGIHDELARNNMHLLLARLDDRQLTDDNFTPKILREWMTDGLLIDYIHRIPPRLVALVEQHQLPAVWINAKQGADCIHPDDFEAGKRATEHLLSLGHQRIAFADYTHSSHLDQEHYSAGDRCAGYEAVMLSAGLDPQIVREQDEAVLNRERVSYSRAWLEAPQRPTAVVTYDSEYAPIMVAAMGLGLRVPEQLSIVTFGAADTNFSGLPVTAMTGPEYATGSAAVKMLLQKILNPKEKLSAQKVPFGFAAGATCLPVGSSAG